jgi:hypothetical protein
MHIPMIRVPSDPGPDPGPDPDDAHTVLTSYLTGLWIPYRLVRQFSGRSGIGIGSGSGIE